MNNAVSSNDLSEFDQVPFHGALEDYAKLYTWLVLIEAACLILFPWLFAWVHVLHHSRNYVSTLLPATSAAWLAFVDVLGVVTAMGYYMLYKRLSARIAVGGADAVFMDGIRLSVASLGQGIIALFFLILMHIHAGALAISPT
jgi:hypothetical protein